MESEKLEKLIRIFIENPSSLDKYPDLKIMLFDLATKCELFRETKQYNFLDENLYLSSYSKKNEDKFQMIEENIYEKKINIQEKTGIILTKENVNYICCQVKIYFKKECPLYCSGVFIDKNHVLTVANSVTLSTPKNITVFSYLEDKQDFSKANDVIKINIPTQYISKKKDIFDYAILTLKEEIYFPDNNNFWVLPKSPNLLKEYEYFEYKGFKNIYKKIRSFIGSHIKDNKFKIKTVIGSGGAPLFGIRDNLYQFIGISLGIDSNDKQNKCLIMDPNIIETINFIIMNEKLVCNY